MEISTLDNEELVRNVYEHVYGKLQKGEPVEPDLLMVYEIDFLLMEVNSGASFEQYFRWATVEQINRIISSLQTMGLNDIAELTAKATMTAFPNGVPENDIEKSDKTDWSEDQEAALGEYFAEFEDHNDRITNVLAEHVKKSLAV